MTVEGGSTGGPVVASGSGGPVEAALLARVEAAEADNERLRAENERYCDALAEVSRWRDTWLDAKNGWERTAKSNGEMYDQTAADMAVAVAKLRAVEALADEWEAKAGPQSSAWTVYGPQRMSVPFVVEKLRAALADPVRPRRYDQCDDTCTVDCGHCKGRGKPVGLPTTDEPETGADDD